MARERWIQQVLWRFLPWRRKARETLPKGLQPETRFRQQLIQERKRAERANKPLLVMLVNPDCVAARGEADSVVGCVGRGLQSCLRETDICGVLNDGALVGVILTEIWVDDLDKVKKAVARKAREKLSQLFEDEVARRVTISFRIYPESGGKSGAFDMIFYPEQVEKSIEGTAGEIAKRGLDLLGSATGLVLLAPAFALIASAIKLTSDGPVFFQQQRIGCNGRKFKLLKFRTMYIGNDDQIHRDYVKLLIQGKVAEEQGGVFKITVDPRVTPIGKVLRKYSLDELPQLFNVLKGEMALVGPRPPISYELEHYSGWQRNRLIGKRPGITGAWQVSGRSSTTFDEMVRLDLRYLKGWSLALDFKILLKTPLAVLKCKGAY
ncbi:undecaprenyl-phosphate glycosylphosphotransferase [Citrifermentans bemidjiense Bem]|uniref:Undecaprenyl-phosphate glycosylphosphotransferase n=1 Tax=Citrifermentans bemidjiense (strain ATCC BAA-1014 / DSM 16622 / JCM 12645 / Bem) TaxID=404380 RepID=B5EGY2_CITBB|nr:sugar transferase [Citrifermentans bemidjiense]ACH38084.1 undecaprenyl-phosphate glycosylphosphotransferase [Citrifermentans bemidjiense Bem]